MPPQPYHDSPQQPVTGAPARSPWDDDAISRTVLDALQKHIALLDGSGNIVLVNQAWRQFALDNGASAAQADPSGTNYLQVCLGGPQRPDYQGAAAAAAGIKAVLTGSLPSFELEYPCHSAAEQRWFLLRARPFRGPGGGAVVSHEDITQRQLLEEHRVRLMAELLEFKAALDAHALVAITDAKGSITYVNDMFCAVAKWSREELIGRDHRIINSGHHAKEFIADLWATIRGGRVWKGELKNRAKDGSTYWVDTTIVPLLGVDGQPHHYVAIRAEITQRKLLEESNAQMVAELLAANHELSEFAYVVSHDLKAPLRGISSLASWLSTDFGEQLGTEGREHVALIDSRVKRLSALIDAILAYSRAGRQNDNATPVALQPLVSNVIELLAPPQHIRVEIISELPSLMIEAVKIQQVFQNLISNAIDFCDKPEGRVTVDCIPDAAAWHFSVADNGPGIEPKYFERIFGLFQTLTSRDDRERTGVGLALVKKIVELEHGAVWVESTVGSGTIFHFTIPYPPSAQTA